MSTETPAQKFARLAAEWHHETAYLSNMTKLLHHPAYQKIIGMGPAVVPLILAELERKPNHWFAALYFITEAQPIPAADAGNFKAACAAWLRWGREHGHLEGLPSGEGAGPENQ